MLYGNYNLFRYIVYHNQKYKMSLSDLRRLVQKLHKPYIDDSAYWFSVYYNRDEGSLRLPNQSKKGINKDGPPMSIVQGALSDFFVTDTSGLTLFRF